MTASLRGSHGLSAQRARRTKSRKPKGPKAGLKGRILEVKAPKLLVNINMIMQWMTDRVSITRAPLCIVGKCILQFSKDK